jgi:hypothetical protein
MSGRYILFERLFLSRIVIIRLDGNASKTSMGVMFILSLKKLIIEPKTRAFAKPLRPFIVYAAITADIAK